MERTCPTCNQLLPEVETLKYRFCPHCGAEIAAEPVQIDAADLTIPPDLTPPEVDARPGDVNPVPEKKIAASKPFDDHTIAPQPAATRNRPQIKPPTEPTPTTLFRTPPPQPNLPPPISEKQRGTERPSPPPLPNREPPTRSHHKLIVAVLIILALAILILGGLFTF